MARIIEGERRIIKMSVDDIINIVREYQQITHNSCCYEHTRELLARADFLSLKISSCLIAKLSFSFMI